ncbi:MAG: RNA polymerase sigma-70 factor [Chitinophagaceae bacterium]|jgi:RNA polymerase sigma-70 factor (ECF subfamily)|nr:MAG: RNA polymerase sigma-70 factor [Chitinophagaceae bacterium]
MKIYSSHTDEYLFSLLRNDDEKAFTELYRRYWKRLLVKANLLLHCQEDAEEVVHDVFVGLWKKRATLHILHSFHTYITAMLHYSCFESLAKRKRLRTRIVVGTTDEDLEQADFSTQQWMAFDDLREELEVAVCRLPEKCQLIFRLSREQNLSDKEISENLHLSVNTVRTQMHRALEKLKTSLTSFFFF